MIHAGIKDEGLGAGQDMTADRPRCKEAEQGCPCLQAGKGRGGGFDHAGHRGLHTGSDLCRWDTNWKPCAEQLAEGHALGLQEDPELGQEQVGLQEGSYCVSTGGGRVESQPPL